MTAGCFDGFGLDVPAVYQRLQRIAFRTGWKGTYDGRTRVVTTTGDVRTTGVTTGTVASTGDATTAGRYEL